MARIATLQDSAHAIRRAFFYESAYLHDGTGERRVDAVHLLVFAASMSSSNRRRFHKFTIHVDGLGYVCIFAVLTSSDTTASRSVTLYLLFLLADSHLYVYMRSLVRRREYRTHSWSDVQGRKDEMSSVSFKETHPE